MTGMHPNDAEAFWNHFEASGWIDKNGNRVVRWQNKMATWKTVARSGASELAHHFRKPKTTFELKTIIEAKNARAQELKNKHYTDAPIGGTWTTQEAKTEFITLRREAKQLTIKLSQLA
jgi:hypothetical protein